MKDAVIKRRMTRQRRLILETLRSLHTHPTAEELYEAVRQQMPRISLGTVYRNLDVLCRSGLVLRLESARQQAHFDGDVSRHYHIRCAVCGKIEDVYPAEVSGISDPQIEHSSFRVMGWTLMFDGICPECMEGSDLMAGH